MTTRYAIYFAPTPDSPIGRFGQHWLGRDAWSGDALTQPSLPDLPAERLRTITRSPRQYGFHGTLKAPFALAAGRSAADLHDSARGFAESRTPFELAFEVSCLSGFLAFTPAAASAELAQLAADVVVELDGFRRPAGPEEIERRRRSGLTPRQDEHLLRWGYPYVFEDFRFHMTLTERLEEPERSEMLVVLRTLAAVVCAAPLVIDAVAVFAQPARDHPFRLTARYPFTGGASR